MDRSSALVNSRYHVTPPAGQMSAQQQHNARLLAGLTSALPRAQGPQRVAPGGALPVGPPGLSPPSTLGAPPAAAPPGYPAMPSPQPRAPLDCIDLLKRQQGAVPPPPGMNAIPPGSQRPYYQNGYFSPAVPEFYPPWMQSDVAFSPTRTRPIPPPPDQSPVYDRTAPSPLGERTNLPPDHDLQEKKQSKADPNSITSPVKAAISAQRQELEDQIRAMLGAATVENSVGGNTTANVPEISVENLPEDMPSVGSVGHDIGECRRCNFFPNGHCMNGKSCAFCHFPHEKRKLSRRERRERRLERQKEEQENGGVALSDVSSTTTTPTVTPTAGAFTSTSSISLLGHSSEVATPTVSPTVTPTAGTHMCFATQPQPAKMMCSSETQTEDDLPPCVHCGAVYTESVEDQAQEPSPETGSPNGDDQGPPGSDMSEPENGENDEDTWDTPRRIATGGG